jgi:hypothetical protein
VVSSQITHYPLPITHYPLPIFQLERGILAESQNWPRLLRVGEVKIPAVFD